MRGLMGLSGFAQVAISDFNITSVIFMGGSSGSSLLSFMNEPQDADPIVASIQTVGTKRGATTCNRIPNFTFIRLAYLTRLPVKYICDRIL